MTPFDRKIALAACLALVALPATLLAQEDAPPVPSEPPLVDTGLPIASPDKATRTNVAPVPWRLSLTALSGYESNARFSVAPESDANGRLRLALERSFTWPKVRVSLLGEGSGVAYLQLEDLNSFGYSGQFGASFDPSSDLSFGLDQAYRADQARNQRGLVETGQIFEQVYTRTYSGNARASWRVTPDVTPRIDLRYEDYRFDSTSLTNGSQFTARGAFDRGGSSRQWGGAYEFRRQNTDETREGLGSGSTSHSLQANWSVQRREGLTASLSAGLLHVRPLGEGDEAATTPTGALTVGYKTGRHRLTAGYNRGVGLAYGAGATTVNDTLSMGETYMVTPRLSFSVQGLGVQSRDPLDRERVYRSLGAGLLANWRVSPRVTLVPSYNFFRYTQGELGTIVNHTVTVSLTHERRWK